MARQLATAETIRELMQRRIRESAMGGDCAGCEAPTPIRLQEPDPVTALPSLSPGCHDFVTYVVFETMKEYNLE